jgi:hypothetical protein
MSLKLKHHGGLCCGIRHIHRFYGEADQIKVELKRLMAQVPQGRTRCRLIEVVLTDRQRKLYGKILEDEGFKIVSCFKNANSRSTLYVYHYVKYPVKVK